MRLCMWFFTFLILNLVLYGLCWDILAHIGSRRRGKKYIFKNEYIFGDCKRRDKKLYTSVHKTIADVQKSEIIREWLLTIKRLPTCIILRASTYDSDTFRVTKYNFAICVPRVTFCYGRKRMNYYYYEWYLPTDMAGGMDWDIYFYGPEGEDWVD